MKRWLGVLLGSFALLGAAACSEDENKPLEAVQTEADAIDEVQDSDDRSGEPDAMMDLGRDTRPEPAPEPELPDEPEPEPDLSPAPDMTPELDMAEEPDLEPEPDLADEPPMVMEPPPLPTYSEGACPILMPSLDANGPTNTGFVSSGDMRQFRLLVPPGYDGSEPWPLMFAWHWLNASGNSFIREGELVSAAEQMGFLVVLPEGLENDNGDDTYLFDWPFAEDWGAEKELLFFDDMLACVTEQYNVDPQRIYGIGVSAGALWLTYLSTTEKVNHLAAVVSLSGGLGEVLGAWEMAYAPQPRKFPALVLWGGPSDWLGVDFAAASMRYEEALAQDNHFVIRCVHDSGHAVPPIDPPDEDTTRFISLWQFMLDHPYGTPTGTSPYQIDGLPEVMPEWCTIATP